MWDVTDTKGNAYANSHHQQQQHQYPMTPSTDGIGIGGGYYYYDQQQQQPMTPSTQHNMWYGVPHDHPLTNQMGWCIGKSPSVGGTLPMNYQGDHVHHCPPPPPMFANDIATSPSNLSCGRGFWDPLVPTTRKVLTITDKFGNPLDISKARDIGDLLVKPSYSSPFSTDTFNLTIDAVLSTDSSQASAATVVAVATFIPEIEGGNDDAASSRNDVRQKKRLGEFQRILPTGNKDKLYDDVAMNFTVVKTSMEMASTERPLMPALEEQTDKVSTSMLSVN
jgi:hypothetical protein